MQQTENNKGDLHICSLSKDEKDKPILVLQSFVEDLSLPAVRSVIETMSDICITTENVFFGEAETREDLLYSTRQMIKFFEAAYLFFKKKQPQDGKLALHGVGEEKPTDRHKLMRVLQRSIPSRLGPYTFPCLNLYGKWMERAGFHTGDEVSVSSEQGKILITVNREWDKERGDFRMRA